MKSANFQLIRGRQRGLREIMCSKKLDCLILTTVRNVRYLTGFTGEDSWAMVTGRRVYLFTDSRYTEQAAGECVNTVIIERSGSMSAAIGEKLDSLDGVKSCGIEDRCSVGVFRAVKKSLGRGLRAVGGAVEQLRRTKSAEESRAISRASGIAWESLSVCLKKIRTGMSEKQLAAMIDFEIAWRGSESAFDTIVAFGANGSRPHHRPGEKKLRKNDTVLIDFGAVYDGYNCDLTRCFAVGRVSGKFRRAYESVVRGQQAAIDKVRAGAGLFEVDSAAREVIESADFGSFGHGTGHGLGLEVHESPAVSPRSSGNLFAGDVVTIEPGVYLPGEFGIRIEDDVLVTEGGGKILSADGEYGFDDKAQLRVLEAGQA